MNADRRRKDRATASRHRIGRRFAIITANDLAAGWVSDPDGVYSLVPSGEYQHELTLRGGFNLVMYTLTGNYKSGLVHVRDLLEPLAH